jgi:hypothetical protein
MVSPQTPNDIVAQEVRSVETGVNALKFRFTSEPVHQRPPPLIGKPTRGVRPRTDRRQIWQALHNGRGHREQVRRKAERDLDKFMPLLVWAAAS